VQTSFHPSSKGRAAPVNSNVSILEREIKREPTRRRLTELESEVHELAGRIDALLEAVARMARQHYRSPHLPENTLSAALHDARRR
jgi:hypothetical protein